jgi:ankyrin repeat protein
MSSSPDFFEAIKNGDRDLVVAFLNQDSSLASSSDDGGLSAVLTATYYGQSDIARLLVERGAPLTLFEAAATGQIQQVREIIETNLEQPNAFSPDGFQPLGLASFFGHTDVARYLLEQGAEVNAHSRNDLRVQPLNSAAAGQHLDIARLLLAQGANPNARQGEGFTPLHAAVDNGQIEMVRLLLEHGADPSAVAANGKTPRDLAVEKGHLSLLDLLP